MELAIKFTSSQKNLLPLLSPILKAAAGAEGGTALA
jgi:hypothetical protein